MTESQNSTVRCRFGLFEFDFRSGELRREGQVVKLPPQPARVLGLLLEKPGEVVLRDELRAHLWGDETFVDFERGLNFCILQVRSALGDSSDNPRFVQTVPRKGYRFIAPVTTPELSHLRTPEPRNFRTPEPRNFGTPELRLAVLGLLILIPVAWLALARDASRSDGPAAANRIRVAVLPFANLTGDAEADYVADGLTDERGHRSSAIAIRKSRSPRSDAISMSPTCSKAACGAKATGCG
jgi:DNA-binding winged helix-turn-helix (wHTH) protein